MTFQTSTLPIPALLIVFSFVIISVGLAEITCPGVVTIEKGGTGIVSCDTAGKRTVLAYWYIGDPATTRPILRLENGNPGGTLYGNGHYNITTSGAMIIKNAKIKHEAVYSTLLYFHDDTDERNHIKVNITISPLSPCPVINFCNPCEECSLAVNDSGKLKCSLRGVRPLTPLKWIFNPQHGVSIVEHPPTVINNVSSDTWSSTVEISYALSSCSQEAKFQCEAQDTFNLLGRTKSTVEIYTANCTGNSPEHIGAHMKTVLIVVGVCFGIISSAGFVTYHFLHRSRGDKTRHQGYSPSSNTEELPLVSQLPASKKITEEYAQTLSNLEEHYKAVCEKARLPWVKSIGIEDIYTACTCNITDSNRDKSSTSSDRLLTCKAIKDERLVLITGGPKYWEELFLEHLVHQWIHANKNDFILLLIDRKDICFNQRVIDILEQVTSISSELLAKIIKNKKCVFLLYGLTDVKFDGSITYDDNCKLGRSTKSDSFLNLTFSDLFKQLEEGKLTQVHVWVSTGNEGNIEKVLSEQFARVNVSDVNVEQLGAFIARVHKQRAISLKQAPFGKNRTDNSVHNTDIVVQDTSNEYERDKEDNCTGEHLIEENRHKFASGQTYVSNQESVKLLTSGKHIKDKDSYDREQMIHYIADFFKQNPFFGEFKETPLLLSIMAHAVIKKYCSQPTNFDEVKTLTIEGIVCAVIDCLMEDSKLEQESKDSSIDMNLGKLAMHLIDTQRDVVDIQSNIDYNFGKDVKIALNTGILQYANKHSETHRPMGSSETAPCCVEFFHRYLKYYFAAYYNIQRGKFYTEALGRYDESKDFPVLRFTIHLKEGHIEQVLDCFREIKSDDDVIDCLYKWDNQNGRKKVIKELQGKDLKVTSLEKVKHREAFKSFCEKCGEMQVHIKSLLVSGKIPMSFMTLDIPVLDELTFFDISVNEEVFLRILKWLSQKDIILRFLKCDMPDTLSETFKTEIDNLKPAKLKTLRQPGKMKNVITAFNYETAKWT